MDTYYLKIQIKELEYIKIPNIYSNIEEIFQETKKNSNNLNYDIDFELTKSKEKYTLNIHNDKKGNPISSTNCFNIPTAINISEEENNFINNKYIDEDYLQLLLYCNIKLTEISQDIIITKNSINKNNSYADIYIQNIHIIFTYNLFSLGDTDNLSNFYRNNDEENYYEINSNNNYISDDKDIINTNIHVEETEEEEEDLITKFINSQKNAKKDEITYDDSIFEKIDTKNIFIKNEKNEENNSYKSQDSNDSNNIIFSESDDEEKPDITFHDSLTPYITKSKNNLKSENNSDNYVYKNYNLSLYEIISLEKPKLIDISENNKTLIETFLISGLSKNKKILKNSETYIPQCKHSNCLYNISYNCDIYYYFQKNNCSLNIESSIAQLIFTQGCKICYGENINNCCFLKEKNEKYLKGDYSFNVLTDVKGKKYFIYSLIFFIKIEINEFKRYFNEYSNLDTQSSKNIYIPFAFSLISEILDIINFNIILKDLFYTYQFSKMNIDDFDNELVHLLYEIPYPKNNTKLNIYLPAYNCEIYSNVYEDKIHNCLDIKKILIDKYKYSFKFIIKLFLLFLLEKKIIIHSSINIKIYETIELIHELIYPFKWVSVYIPLIPDENIIYVLQSFIPFIIGISHQSFFNYANDIEKLNSDNLYIINLDTENIMTSGKNLEISLWKSQIFKKINKNYLFAKDIKEISQKDIKKIFLDAIIDIIGDYEKYTSIVGGNCLFNQKMFLKNKEEADKDFYKDFTSTQLFYQFINDISFDTKNTNLYFKEFKQKITNAKSEKINVTEYSLYPYFWEENIKQNNNIDLFTFEEEIDIYYNCKNDEQQMSYILDTEAYLRINLIMKNYIPTSLKKYNIDNNLDNKNNKEINLSEFNSNISTFDSESDINLSSNNFQMKNILFNFYDKMKNSKIINVLNSVINNNKTNLNNLNSNNLDNNKQVVKKEKILYRKRLSIINMIKNNCDKKEILLHREQIIDLLNDYMGYILSNECNNISFSLDDLINVFQYKKIRKEFSKIIFQEKFNNGIEHELSNETFELLVKIVNFCLKEIKENEFKILRLMIKSLFYFYYKNEKQKKVYLYKKITGKFWFFESGEFWKFYYIQENKLNKYDDNIDKVQKNMKLLGIDDLVIKSIRK